MAAREFIIEFYLHLSIFKNFIKKRFKYFCIWFQKDLGKRSEVSDSQKVAGNFMSKRIGRTGPGEEVPLARYFCTWERVTHLLSVFGENMVQALLGSALLPLRICLPAGGTNSLPLQAL